MPTALALANQKGGVGKTTTALNLAAGLALAGRQVLLIDLDPQANATSGLGLELHGDHRRHPLISPDEKTALPSGRPNLTVVPSTPDLLRVEESLLTMHDAAQRLGNFLARQAKADYVIIDCPPSLGLLTRNALAAASGIIIPIQCEYYAMEGLTRILTEVEAVQTRANPNLSVAGILLTMYDPALELAVEVAEEVASTFPQWVFSSVIPRDVTLSEASSFGQTIFEYAPRSRASMAYMELTREVLDHE